MSYGIVGSSPSLPPVNLKNGSLSLTTNTSNTATEAVAGYKWRLVISYDGTRYSGWQYQKWPPTVQCVVEEALTQATNLQRRDLSLAAASRTDRGVHALGQVAHFVTPFNFDDLGSNHVALNGLLPCDIRIRELTPALPQFHARFSVESKVYHYKIYQDTVMDPFLRMYAYHCPFKLNTHAMREAAKYFVGKHDFSAFANASHDDGVVRNPVKNIFRFDVNEMGALLQLEVEGSGFLYRQVRNMVALLIQIGKEAIPPDIVPMILESRDRRDLAKYAFFLPPHGLYLESVKFNEEHLRLPSGCTMGSIGRHHTITKYSAYGCMGAEKIVAQDVIERERSRHQICPTGVVVAERRTQICSTGLVVITVAPDAAETTRIQICRRLPELGGYQNLRRLYRFRCPRRRPSIRRCPRLKPALEKITFILATAPPVAVEIARTRAVHFWAATRQPTTAWTCIVGVRIGLRAQSRQTQARGAVSGPGLTNPRQPNKL